MRRVFANDRACATAVKPSRSMSRQTTTSDLPPLPSSTRVSTRPSRRAQIAVFLRARRVRSSQRSRQRASCRIKPPIAPRDRAYQPCDPPCSLRVLPSPSPNAKLTSPSPTGASGPVKLAGPSKPAAAPEKKAAPATKAPAKAKTTKAAATKKAPAKTAAKKTTTAKKAAPAKKAPATKTKANTSKARKTPAAVSHVTVNFTQSRH